MDRIEKELRLLDPTRGLKCDWENSRSAAIDLHCKSCMGGRLSDGGANPKDCTDQLCALWRYRPGSGSKIRKPGIVPTASEYLVLIEKKVSPEKKALGKRLGDKKWK